MPVSADTYVAVCVRVVALCVCRHRGKSFTTQELLAEFQRNQAYAAAGVTRPSPSVRTISSNLSTPTPPVRVVPHGRPALVLVLVSGLNVHWLL